MRVSSALVMVVALVLALALACAGPVSAQDKPGTCDPCDAACEWPRSSNEFYKLDRPGGVTMKDLTRTVACLRAITVPYDLAVQTATSLAKFWEENYVFNNIAKDPLATPHTSNMVPINPYTKGVDVPAQLNAMAAAWPVNQLVPFYDVSLNLNNFFNELRDGHVFVYGDDPVVNRILGTIGLFLVDRNDGLVFGLHYPVLIQAAGVVPTTVALTTIANGIEDTKIVKTIDGLSWVDWCRGQVTGAITFGNPMTQKNIGYRLNRFMAQLINSWGGIPNFEFTAGMGDIEALAEKVFDVEFFDGNKTSWQYATGFVPEWIGTTSENRSALVSHNPSTLYQSLQAAGDAYFDRNATVQVTRRSLRASARGADVPMHADGFGAVAAAAVRDKAHEGRGGRSLAQAAAQVHERALSALAAAHEGALSALAAAGGEAPAAQAGDHVGARAAMAALAGEDAATVQVYSGDEMDGLSNDTAWGSNFIMDRFNNTIAGTYAIMTSAADGSKYAVWKLNTCDLDEEQYVTHWVNFVKMATDAKVTRLMYDVSDNGGGRILIGIQAAALLFPELADAHAPRNEVDVTVGPAAAYCIKQGLLPGSKTGEVPRALSLVANETYIAERVGTVQSEPGLFAALVVKTKRMVAAMDILVKTGLLASGPGLPGSCVYEQPDGSVSTTENCTRIWAELAGQATEALDFEDPSLFNAAALATLLGVLKKGLLAFQPLNALVPMDLKDLAKKSNPYKPPIERTRGGVSSLYSQPFYMGESNLYSGGFNLGTLDPLLRSVGLLTPYASPFTSVLAISNGRCGSTCANWGLTCWLHSKTTPNATSFKWLTYGGTGHEQNIQPVSFSVGFIGDSDQGKPETPKMWAYWAFFSLIGEWLGDAAAADAAVALMNKIPEFPALGNDLVLPTYVQGEMFSHMLGGAAGSAPTEYLRWPNDHYIPKWYINVTGVDADDIWPLYADAEAFLPAA
ncbi:hypothetical protein FOA52_010082 [Chlamydomonas sp. UWO 241]|nr:hypothetical protein FOA52_010082 [Chlamydomonas sp. UWO 241]